MTEDWLINRVQRLNEIEPNKGKYVIYLMQSSQRADYNQALEYAIKHANKQALPLLVIFALTKYPEANTRHYRFMLEGLIMTSESLWERGAQFKLVSKDLAEACIRHSKDASLVVLDRGYQKGQKKWYRLISEKSRAPVIQVESDTVIPVEAAAEKEMYMAVHLRNRIIPDIPDYLIEPPRKEVKNTESVTEPQKIDIEALMKSLNIEKVEPSIFRGGRKEAIRIYMDFIEDKLEGYAEYGNDPNMDYQSNMSPYLHFGQISPIELALKIKEKEEGSDEYLEQLIVRRELAFNMVFYNPDYDNLNCLPDWARTTLNKHSDDPREYIYSQEELEKAETHDPYWNKAQKEMVHTGKMHGYMRMYWGKKILEWSKNPEAAYNTALYLNNKYELDGRSCNGYTGIAWCFGKHDRAWKERSIFGKVRYMNDKGLERKFDMESYLASGFNI